MERLIVMSWIALALLHAVPAVALFAPDMITRLYGASASGPIGVMLQHRAALFLCLCIIGLAATFQPEMRKVAVIVFAVSMTSFIILYGLDGWQPGPLRTIAIADGVGLLPLLIVANGAFRQE